MLGRNDAPLPTRDIANRTVVEIDQISDAEVSEMVQIHACRFWVAPDSHAVHLGCSMHQGNMYNPVLPTPHDLEERRPGTQGNLDEMRQFVEAWDLM